MARDGDVLVVCEVKTRRNTLRTARRSRRSRGARQHACGCWRCAGWPRTRPLRARCASTWSESSRTDEAPRASTIDGACSDMALARTRSVALVGVVGQVVDVEVDLGRGLPAVVIVGLPDAALNEARDRVRAALANSGATFPDSRVTINLSPASLPKHGTGFDLALAVALLAATEVVPRGLRRPAGLPRRAGPRRQRPGRARSPPRRRSPPARPAGVQVVVAPANAGEAALVPGIDRARRRAPARASSGPCGASASGRTPAPPSPREVDEPLPDLGDVAGQPEGRHALEVAAAGGHHLLLQGPPGRARPCWPSDCPSILPAAHSSSTPWR